MIVLKNFYKWFALCLAGVFLLSVSLRVIAVSHVDDFHIHGIVVFGDGLSDNGNTFKKYDFPVMPPYWHGRFSNGPVFVEYLAYHLGLIPNPQNNPNYDRRRFFRDYAYFNAVVLAKDRDMSMKSPLYVPITFAQEVDIYLQRHHHILYPPSTLVVVYIGNNDAGAPQCLANSLQCLEEMMNETEIQLARLCKAGFTHFLLVLPTDVRTKPGFTNMVSTTEFQNRYVLLVRNYISDYSSIKVRIETNFPKVHVTLVPTIDLEEPIVRSFTIPEGIPCYNNGKLIYTHKIPSSMVCSDPNHHVYFDNYFPSARFSSMFADDCYEILQQAGWAFNNRKHWWQRIIHPRR